MKFTFGSDPEFMVEKDGKILSAIGIIKGTKDRKKKIGNCAFYYDNVLGECCIPPAGSKEEAVENIGDCLTKFAKLVSPHKILARASHTYDVDQLNHEDAMLIGCSRENCAYILEEIQPDEEMFKKTNLRSAGGHIHLGANLLLQSHNAVTAIRLLDLFLGVPAIFIDHDPTSKKRKELYGKAGRFRQPPYGIEYRSVGNFWLSSPVLVELVYDICDFVLDFIESGKHKELWEIDDVRLASSEAWSDLSFHPSQCHHCKGYDVKALRKVVDKGDAKGGKEFLELTKRYFPATLFERIQEAINSKQYDLYKEWKLQ